MKDKILLITGGTGSFGNAAVEKFLDTNHFKEIRIFSRDEKKQDDMRNYFRNPKLKFYIGDVRDPQSLDIAMKGVDYVFHAAALKQVPSLEFFPLEAAKTHVFGSQNVISSAISHKVKKVILMSTDKAVYPINAMGISKALMEKVAVAASRTLTDDETVISVVRYGNIMASRGSVIPLFLKQIKSGKALTITNPNMTRFLMSIHDSVELVLFAFENGKQGDIFVNKAPSGTVGDLAEALKQICNANNPIQVIGLRHGEKTHETLCSKEEMVVAQDMGNFYRIPADCRDLNYTLQNLQNDNLVQEGYTSDNAEQKNVEDIKNILLKLPYIRREVFGEDAKHDI